MTLKSGMLMLLAAAWAASGASVAHAEGSTASPGAASSSSSAGSFLNTIQKKGIANYLAWLTGPNTQALSGNKDGTGTNLSIAHYGAVGWKFNDKVSLTFTQAVTQSIDNKPANEVNPWVFSDPYLTLSNSKLMHSDRYGTNLYAYLRYYVPISRTDHDTNNAGRFNDTGLGALRIYVNPSIAFLDGKLTFSGQVLSNIKFASLSRSERAARSLRGDGANPKGDREDFYVIFDPVLDYSISPKLDVYIEYASGYLRHRTSGHFVTNPRTPGDGQYISPGVYWNPTKKVSLNPYLSWGPEFRGLKNTDIGIQAQYNFL